MKPALVGLAANLPSIAFALWAGVLCYDGKEGWGWFLCAAIICVHSWSEDKGE